MMGAFMKSDTPRSQREREQAWVEKYERYEEERELARARRQAVLRWIRNLFVGSKKAEIKEALDCSRCPENGRGVCCGGRTLVAS